MLVKKGKNFEKVIKLGNKKVIKIAMRHRIRALISDINNQGLEEIRVHQDNLEEALSRAITRIENLGNRVGNLWFESNTNKVQDLYRKCANLEIELICQRDFLNHFNEENVKCANFKSRVGKLFKKTYKSSIRKIETFFVEFRYFDAEYCDNFIQTEKQPANK